MNKEKTKLLMQWLAFLEPKFLHLHAYADHWALSAYVEWYDQHGKRNRWHIADEMDLWTDESRLFEACCNAARARGWHPSLLTKGKTMWLAAIDDASVTNKRMGVAMATALILSHGVTDWDSRAPTSSPL